MIEHRPRLTTPTRRGLVTGLGAAGMAVGLGGCDYREYLYPSLRVRLLCKITAEVDAKVYSNGTVFEILYWDDGLFNLEWKRHAPYCDLGSHGVLFWDRNGGGESLRPFTIVRGIFGDSGDRGRLKMSEFVRLWRKLSEPIPVNLEPKHVHKDRYSYIGLVHIWDRNLRARDAGSSAKVIENGARRKSVQDLRKEGIEVTSITFEHTTAPITDVFNKVLPNVESDRRNATLLSDGQLPTNQLLKVGHLVGAL